jgi:hypothetical protein
MKHLDNCTTYRTGISKPHTIDIEGRLTSIIDRSALPYYTHMKKYATATDTTGNNYTVYAKDFPEKVVAVPEN